MKFEIELSEKQVDLLNDLINKEVTDLIAYQDDFLNWKNEKDEENTQYDKLLEELKFKIDTYSHIQFVFVTQPAIESLKNAMKKPIENIGTINF